MNYYFIQYIAASGDDVQFSKIEFAKGINIIHGPSNTGKSYVLGCLNFMFGGDIPFTKSSTGYDTITISFESVDGNHVWVERKIVDGKSGERGDNIAKISSTVGDIESGEYRIREKDYSDILLRLIGIDKRHKIIAKQDGTQNDLTIRTIFHFSYIDEEHILGKLSPFYSPNGKQPTPFLSALLFLLNGNDYQNILPQESPAEREKKATQRAGVISYLTDKIQELMQRRAELEKDTVDVGDIDIEAAMDEAIREINELDQQIASSSEERKKLVEQMYTANAQLEEARFLQDRYNALRSQYASDVRRLRFITDGERKRSSIQRLVVCPFCDREMAEDSEERESYLAAAGGELERVKTLMDDLQEVQGDVAVEITMLEDKIRQLEIKNQEVTKVVNEKLMTRAAELNNTVNTYRNIIMQRQEIYAIEAMATELNTDVTNQTYEFEEADAKFDPRKILGQSEHWMELNSRFNEMVRECAYPGFPVSRIDIDTCDAVVNGRHKRNEGKGYRAFLNTIMLFNLMRYLDEHGVYAPHCLFLDSPILSLKEKKQNITQKEKATPSMKESLFRYMVTHCDGDQVIIAENELPVNVDYSSARLIEFTQDEDKGRYGFFLTRPAE